MPQPVLAAGILDEDPPHRLGRGREEMAAVLPALVVRGADQAQVGLVNQRRRLERLAGVFSCQLLRRQLAKLLVDQGQQLAGSRGVALFDRDQDAARVIHYCDSSKLGGNHRSVRLKRPR